MLEFLTIGADRARTHLLLAHGAGAPMTSDFLGSFAGALVAADADIQVSRFEFSYMATRRAGGARRPPPKMNVLVQEYQRACAALPLRPGQALFIGGKSMGGRVASLVADDLFGRVAISGLVCLGYPFHPAGHPERVRTAHLERLRCPTLIVQGTRDALGSQADVAGYALSEAIQLAWLLDGDHDFKPRRSSGFTQGGHISQAAQAVAQFIGNRRDLA
jgi:predicted alpha/beta-hydrolase family hydrolase